MTPEQAKRAVKMCIDNATQFVFDACTLSANNRYQHLALSIEFALEEFGKAMIILDKIKNAKYSTKNIVIMPSDCILDHETKLHAAIKTLDLESIKLYLSVYNAGMSYDEIQEFKTLAEVDSKLLEFLDEVAKGHLFRLDVSFVNFSDNGEPILAHDLDSMHFLKIQGAIAGKILQLQKELTPENGYSL